MDADGEATRTQVPAGPDASSSSKPSGIKGALTPAHSAIGPTGGLFEKTLELLQRFEDTPGSTFKERWVGATELQCNSWVDDCGKCALIVLVLHHACSSGACCAGILNCIRHLTPAAQPRGVFCVTSTHCKFVVEINSMRVHVPAGWTHGTPPVLTRTQLTLA
jgi:hypothetical protein